MNSSEPFFPLRLPNGETLLISKSHVLTVHVAARVRGECGMGVR